MLRSTPGQERVQLGKRLGADLNPPNPNPYPNPNPHTFLVFFDTLAYIMVLLDEKPPKYTTAPPPYIPRHSTAPTTSLNAASAPPPFSRPRAHVTFTSLPQHVLLEIVQVSVAPGKTSWTEHRLALWWLARELRLVCRSIYTGAWVPRPGIPDSANLPAVCMHILRSTYLPDYASHIKPYYTSDPFPLSTPSPLDPTFALHSLQRETAVLDQFILLKIKEDIKYDESELHLEGEGFRDIFELLQVCLVLAFSLWLAQED